MKLFYVLISILGFNSLVHAQSDGVKVLAKVKAGEVWLRWAPTDAANWQLGIQHGYTIERFTLTNAGELRSKEPIILTSQPVKPYGVEQMTNLSQSIPEAAALQEIIYQTETKTISAMQESRANLLINNERLTNRFGISLLICDLSTTLAKAAGLFFVDTTASMGERYIYKIRVAKETKPASKAGVIVVDVVESKELRSFTDVTATFGDRTVTISWPTLTHMGIYTAYMIQKSMDGKNFTTITDLPYVPMSESTNASEAHFVDSLENNKQTYYYTVIGITPFGEKGPPSNVVSGEGRDNLMGVLILSAIENDNKGGISVEWDFPTDMEGKINGFSIKRSPRAEGPYTTMTKRVLQKKDRTTTIEAPTTSAYLRIEAYDKKGNVLCQSYPYFFHVEDNTPPMKPLGLTGKIDIQGIATLTWKRNTDNDLLGYRVFTSDDLNHEFIEVTTEILALPQFNDTVNIRVLNRKIFYKIVAVDNNFNTSDYSAPVTLYRPDIIPPAAPVIQKIEVKEQSVELRWTNSGSTDVRNYILYRTSNGDSAKVELMAWRANRTRIEFVDKSLEHNKSYRYFLSVFDSAGNASTTKSRVVFLPKGPLKAVTDIRATIERDKRMITIAWGYDEKPQQCLLYRRKNNEPYSLYQTFEGSVSRFVDEQVQMNNTYSYKLQLVLAEKARTQLSKELKVPF